MPNIRANARALIDARQHHPGWRLLAAHRAPLVLACLQVLFDEAEDGIEIETALQALSELLAEHANDEELGGGSDYATEARAELREWIRRRLVIEREGRLYATDALEKALDFVAGLERRLMTSTASRLSVVQREIENLEVNLNPDADRRTAHLRRKIAELQRELEQVEQGEVPVLEEAQATEAIRELYNLASGLRADFRRVEDSYRQADHALREAIIASERHRGEILDELLDGHDSLLQTPEGKVFQGFFEQLRHDAGMRETRERLRNIIKHPYCRKALDDTQRSDLRWVFVRLNKESETVLRARERSENDVRGFLQSGLIDEHHRVGELLDALQKAALEMDWERHALRTAPSRLPPVAVDCGNLPLIERLRVKSLEQDEDQSLELSPQVTNLDEIEEDFWLFFDSLDQQALLKETREVLQAEGRPMGLAALAERLPTSHDLETLAFWLGLAREAEVPVREEERETLEVDDREDPGLSWRFDVPRVALTAEAIADLDWEEKT